MKTLFLSLLLILQSIPFAQAQAVPNTYNGSGIPQTKTVRTFNGLLSRIDPAVLHDTRKINPNYLSLDPNKTNVTLRETANIRITFLKEGAGYKNWFGYFTYTGNTPPSNPTLTPIFPNVSQGTGLLQYGDTVLLGSFPTGTKIGFAIVSNGFNNTNNGGYLTGSNYPKFYSIRTLNPDAPNTIYGSGSYSSLKIDTKNTPVQRIAYFWDTIDQVGVIGFDDQLSGDYDFDDVVFTISSDPVAAIIPPDDVPITTVSGVLCHLENNGNYSSITYSGESARDTLFASHADHTDDIKNMATCPTKKTNICHIPGGQDASAAKIISVGNPALANGHENNAHGGDFTIDLNSQADIDRCFSTLCREDDGTTFKRCCNIKLNPNNYSESVETLTSGDDPHYAGESCPYIIPTPTPTSPPVVIPTPTPNEPAPTPTPDIVYPAAVCHAEPVTLPEHPTYTKTSGDADHAVHILNGQDVLPDEAGNCPAHIETTYTICHVLARDPLTNNITNSVEQTINQSEYANHFSSSANHQYTDIEKPISGGCPVAVPDEQISICHYDVPEYSEPVSAKVFKIGSTVTGSESSLTSSHLNAHSAQGDFKIANDLNGNACTSICVAGCDITDPTPNANNTPNSNSTPNTETYSCETTHPNDSCCMSVNESGVTTWKQCCESPSGATLTSGEDPHNSGVMCGSESGTPNSDATPNDNHTPTPDTGTPTTGGETCEALQPGDACCDSVSNGVVTWKSCCSSPSGEILTSGNDPHDVAKVCTGTTTVDPTPTDDSTDCTTVCKVNEGTKKACGKAELGGLLASGWSTNLSACAGTPPKAPETGKSYDFLIQITNMLISSAVGYVGSTMMCVPPPVSVAYFKVIAIASQIMDLFVAAKGVGATVAALQWVISSYGVPWITEKIVSVICKTMGLSETLSPLVLSGTAKIIIQTLVSSFITSATNFALTEGLEADEWGDVGEGTFFGKTKTAKMEKSDPQITSIKKQIYNTQGQLDLNNIQLVVAWTKFGFYSAAVLIEIVDAISNLIMPVKAVAIPVCNSPEALPCLASPPAPKDKPPVKTEKTDPPYQISSELLAKCAGKPACEFSLPAVNVDGKMRPATKADYDDYGNPKVKIESYSFKASELYANSEEGKRFPNRIAHNKALVLQTIIMDSYGVSISTEGTNSPKVPFQASLYKDRSLVGANYQANPNTDKIVNLEIKMNGPEDQPVKVQFSSLDVASGFTAWSHGVSGTYAGDKHNAYEGDPNIAKVNDEFFKNEDKKARLDSLGEKMSAKTQEKIVDAMAKDPNLTYEVALKTLTTPEEKAFITANNSTSNPNIKFMNSQAPSNSNADINDKIAMDSAAKQASFTTTKFSNNEIILYSGRYNFSLTRVFGSSELPVWSTAAKAFDASETEKIIQKVVKIKLQLCGNDIDTAECKQTFDSRFIPWLKSQFEGTPISEPIFEAEFNDNNEKVKLKTFLLEAGYITSATYDHLKFLMNKLFMPNAVAADDEKPGFWGQAGTGATMALGGFVIGKIVQKIINWSFPTSAGRIGLYTAVTALQSLIVADLYKKRDVLNAQLQYQKDLLAYICTNLGGNTACAEVGTRQEGSWEKTLDKVKVKNPGTPAQVAPTPETTVIEKTVNDDLYSFIEEFKNKFFVEKAHASVNSPYQMNSVKIGDKNLAVNFNDNFIKTANQVDPNIMKTLHNTTMTVGRIGNNFLTGKGDSAENAKEMADFINSQDKIQALVKKANNYYNTTAKGKKEKPIQVEEMGQKSLAGIKSFLDSVVTKEQLANFFNIGGVVLVPTQDTNKGSNQVGATSNSNNPPTQVAAVTGVKNNTSTTKPAMKKETRLEDMDVELQDISTNGSNSIFRIISNRYLKVYNN